MKNGELYNIISEAMNGMKENRQSTTDGLFVVAIYKGKKTGKRSESKLFFDGYTLSELDVLLREVYGKIYELRHRNDPKSKKINKKLNDKRDGIA